ncbi:heavy metal sensor histidine kinase [Thiomicrospira sp.]|uniref:heavy metal sensor histidine kinase n=1 Tax=Thiomicrospira sp. TaxID=935 RepID=UPI002F92397F
MKMSLTSRLVWFFSIITLAVLISLGAVLTQAVDHHFQEMDLSELQLKHQQIQYQLQRTEANSGPVALTGELDYLLPRQLGWQFIMFDKDDQPYYASNVALYDIRWDQLEANKLISIHLGENHYRGFLDTQQTTSDWRVLALLNIDHHDHFMQYFLQILWVSLVLAVLLMTGLGWLVMKRALKPLKRMSELASKVSSEHLGERIVLQDLPSELRELAGVFNAMLDRLEASFQRLSQFSADIAHELRTPVNTLLTQSQVALSKARSIEEYQEILASNIEEFECLARMISDMLFLAKADKGTLIPAHERVHLATEAQRVIDYYQLLASEQNIQIKLEGDAVVLGDSVMLGRALANLISNAVRYADPGSEIDVALSQVDHHAIIEVTNQGVEIPLEHRSHLFDRFYRVEPERSHDGGVGLGLAITRSIVEAHGGQIELANETHKTCFRISLPLSPRS